MREGLLGPLFGKLTEGVDFVESFWDALPWEVRRRWIGRPRRVQDKLRDLYNHWDKVDMQAALKNLAYNEVMDLVIGRSSRALHDRYFRAWDDLGITPPAVGPTYGQAQQEYLRNAVPKTQKDPPSRPRAPSRPKYPTTTVDALFYR